ncbi:MAG: 50S ribosomal protein L11 [Candidatus Portnoybacteria bacterium]|nr:50S ribosomal protein L11 [Candidatus Portnoybacteria bacterium]
MPKPIRKVIKIQAPAGQATPAPPLGPVLGGAGINIGQFISQFNEATKVRSGEVLPVQITVYEDSSFEFTIKKPLASALLKKAANVEKGSGEPNRAKVGKVSRAKLEELAKEKMEDLNADTIEAAVKILEGTARSMGIEIV